MKAVDEEEAQFLRELAHEKQSAERQRQLQEEAALKEFTLRQSHQQDQALRSKPIIVAKPLDVKSKTVDSKKTTGKGVAKSTAKRPALVVARKAAVAIAQSSPASSTKGVASKPSAVAVQPSSSLLVSAYDSNSDDDDNE